MKSKYSCFFLIIFLFHAVMGSAQVLTLDAFVRQVISEHPRSKEIFLEKDKANAALLKARGGFDPVLQVDMDQKEFDQKSYYHLVDGNLKIPTNFGLEFKSGYEWSRGLYVNPESITPGGGLLFAGASLPLGKGLLIDEKRAKRAQAEIGVDAADFEIKERMNEWIFEAVEQYLHWQQSFLTVEVLQDALVNINERVLAVGRQVVSGDRPSIDTVEIGIQKQMIELSLRQAQLELDKSRWNAARFLWRNNRWVGLDPGNIPEDKQAELDLGEVIGIDETTFQMQHPTLKRMELTKKQIAIERRYVADQLKPGIWLSYNPLFEPVGNNPFAGFRWDNQKWGLSLAMPVFLRKERGALKKASADLLSLDFKLQDKTSNLYSYYQMYVLEYLSLQQQYEQYKQIVESYGKMFDSEKTLFAIGESSIFLVNARQQALLQAILKQIEFGVKLQKAFFGAKFAIGNLTESFSNLE